MAMIECAVLKSHNLTLILWTKLANFDRMQTRNKKQTPLTRSWVYYEILEDEWFEVSLHIEITEMFGKSCIGVTCVQDSVKCIEVANSSMC